MKVQELIDKAKDGWWGSRRQKYVVDFCDSPNPEFIWHELEIAWELKNGLRWRLRDYLRITDEQGKLKKVMTAFAESAPYLAQVMEDIEDLSFEERLDSLSFVFEVRCPHCGKWFDVRHENLFMARSRWLRRAILRAECLSCGEKPQISLYRLSPTTVKHMLEERRRWK